MTGKRVDFADASTANATILAMIDVLHDRARAGDEDGVGGMLRMLAQAFAGVSRLLGRRVSGISSARLGASPPPERWKDMGPEDILSEMEMYKNVEEAAIELKRRRIAGARSADQRRLDAEVERMRRKFKAAVRSAKAWISKHWPGHWTEKEDHRYGNYLP